MWISKITGNPASVRHTLMLILGVLLGYLSSFLVVRHLHPDGILFYQGLALAVAFAVVHMFLARRRLRLPWRIALKDALLAFLLAYSFVFTIPTTADRSYTVKLLLRLDETPGGMSRDDIGHFYVGDFLEQGGVSKRLVEQQASGTIVEQNGKFALTARGKALTAAFRLTCGAFVCQRAQQ